MTVSSVSAGFSNPFGNSGDLGVGLATILGGSATGTPNAATVAAAGNTAATGVYAALLASATPSAGATATVEALGQGKLTTDQHTILQSIGSGPNGTGLIPWANNGTEPTTVATMKQYGWIKELKPTYDAATRLVTSAYYQLTPVGQAIVARTGGDNVTGGANNAAGSGVDVTA